jgi:tRNA pseudouridine32 synthase/23S rRNA pseudouridine746 synthase/23S rRNA pseudouridine1911/1915/1917 synthase
MTPEAMLKRVLYRDALMLVIDKPAGLPVHAGPGRGPNLEMYLDALRFGLPQPPALAHRLDRDTSGCLVLGRHRRATARLGRLFAAGRVEKRYWALVEGAPPEAEGIVALPLRKRIQDKRHWHMMVHPEGQSALTEYRVLGHAGGRAWVEFKPLTGRTHQIRVHAAALGCPVAGDPVYGPGGGPTCRTPGEPLMLHARAVTVPLYEKRAPILIEAPVRRDMLAGLIDCGYRPCI